MDAIRVARAATGRDVVCKIEGSYHGHHDAVMFSVLPNADTMGGRERPAKSPVSRGLVKDAHRYIEVVPFNDAALLEQLLAERGQEIACLILEPAMMNIGIVLPQPGYLQRVRELCTKHGVVLIYDEIKTGFTIAPGGGHRALRRAARPRLPGEGDLGRPARGGVRRPRGSHAPDRTRRLPDGHLQRQPAGLARRPGAAARGAHAGGLHPLRASSARRLVAGCQAAIDRTGLPAHTIDLGAKGCVSYRPTPLTNYRDFLETMPELFAASYPWLLNRGIFMTPGDEEQWTLSLQHSNADIDLYIEVFSGFCDALAA